MSDSVTATGRRLSVPEASISREIPKDCPRGLSLVGQSTLNSGWANKSLGTLAVS